MLDHSYMVKCKNLLRELNMYDLFGMTVMTILCILLTIDMFNNDGED